MINATLQDINLAVKYRQDHPAIYPCVGAAWAAEVDINHIQRVMDVVAINERVQSTWLRDYVSLSSQFSKGEHSILYSTENLVTDGIIPLSSTKYISRMFYVPHLSRDVVDVITRHPSFCDLIVPQGRSQKVPVFKILAYPKETETLVCDGLEHHALRLQNPKACSLENMKIDMSCLPFDMTRSSSNFSHLICCVYSKFEGLYRWGIVSKEAAQEYCLMFDDLYKARMADAAARGPAAGRQQTVPAQSDPIASNTPVSLRGGSPLSCAKVVCLTPLCRAYDKLAEVVEVHFARWGWEALFMETRDAVVGVDVGASPGGWSQFMLEIGCPKVIAIDPGLLAPELLAAYPDERLVHVPYPVQATETRLVVKGLEESDKLSPASGSVRSFMVACDMNVDPETGIDLVGAHVLNHLFGQRPRAARGFVYLIFTLKLHKHPKQDYIDKMIAFVSSYLVDKGYITKGGSTTDLHCLHANANSINERTLVCRMPL